MRVLMLNHNVAYTGGGTFFRALQLGQRLVRLGHSVTLLASSARAVGAFHEKEAGGVRLVQSPGLLPTRWRYGYDAYETARRLVWLRPPSRRFDLVHAFDCRPVVIYPALAARRRGARLVMDWCDWFGRGGAVEQRRGRLQRAVLRPVETYYEEAFRRRADATTAINAALAERALGLGVAADTLLRLPNGADPDALRPQDSPAARASLGLPTDVPIIAHLGSLFAADAALLHEAFVAVRQACPNARLLLVGNPKNPVEAPGVVVTGYVSYADLGRYLAAADVACLALADTLANRGRWPSRLMDYFSAGRPIVATAVGEVPRLLEENQAGLVAQPDGAALARQLLALLADGELRRRLGQNARRAAETRYDWSILAAQVEALYHRVLQ